MKWDRSSMLTLLYCLFTLLYTIFIAGHPHGFGAQKSDNVFYGLKFLLVDGYCFFLLQGLILRSRNWGILLLLPLAILTATIIAGFLMVGLLRLGGGTLLDNDSADMILVASIWLVLSVYGLKFISAGRKGRQ